MEEHRASYSREHDGGVEISYFKVKTQWGHIGKDEKEERNKYLSCGKELQAAHPLLKFSFL